MQSAVDLEEPFAEESMDNMLMMEARVSDIGGEDFLELFGGRTSSPVPDFRHGGANRVRVCRGHGAADCCSTRSARLGPDSPLLAMQRTTRNESDDDEEHTESKDRVGSLARAPSSRSNRSSRNMLIPQHPMSAPPTAPQSVGPEPGGSDLKFAAAAQYDKLDSLLLVRIRCLLHLGPAAVPRAVSHRRSPAPAVLP